MVKNYLSSEQPALKNSKKHDNRKTPKMVTTEAIFQAMVDEGDQTLTWSSFNEHLKHLTSLRLIKTYTRNLPNGEQVTEVVSLFSFEEVQEAFRRLDEDRDQADQ